MMSSWCLSVILCVLFLVMRLDLSLGVVLVIGFSMLWRVMVWFFVQEYGESLTGIYISEDLRSFRSIAFDGYRGLLIATLGDGNIVRVAVSSDHGLTWRPIYKDPWQFVPVLVDGGRWVFGFDSGIARGGVGIYDVEDEGWRFIFLRLGGHPHAQFASLVRLGSYYVGGLGLPTAIVISEDLRYWYPLYVDVSIPGYNHFVSVIGATI